MRLSIALAALFVACANPGTPRDAVYPRANWCPAEAPHLDQTPLPSGDPRIGDGLVVGCLTEDDVPHGPAMVWNQQTGKIENLMFFDHGVLNGPAMSWYQSGQLWMSYTLAQGHPEGLVTIWHENGQVAARSHFHGGLLDGPWERYDESGRLTSVRLYAGGKLVRAR